MGPALIWTLDISLPFRPIVNHYRERLGLRRGFGELQLLDLSLSSLKLCLQGAAQCIEHSISRYPGRLPSSCVSPDLTWSNNNLILPSSLTLSPSGLGRREI